MPLARMTPLGVVVAALAVLGAPMPGAGQDAATSPAPAAPTASTAWTARVLYPVPARSAPSVTARIRSRLDSVTAYWRRPQGLLVLSDIRTDGAGREWVQVRLPTRPNRASGWVPRRAVALTLTRTRIRVLVSERRVELWRDGRRVRSFPAAVGTGSTPTPAGLFAVQDPVPSVGAQRGYLGPYIVTLTAYSPVLRTFMGGNGLVAIHGTNAPGLLGRAVSHGCIRVSNDAIRRLYRVSAPGTPVEILA